MPSLRNIAIDMVNFTVSNVNDAISFKPHLCKEVPPEQYNSLKNWYIEFTGTSIRKNKCRLFFLPINVSDELQQLNPVIPDEVKITNPDNCELTYYKNRLITELDFENVKRVQRACIYIAYAAINQLLNIETDPSMILESSQSNAGQAGTNSSGGYPSSSHSNNNNSTNNESVDATESCYLSLKRGEVLGFRELGHLINITPWHFHRVFKVITGLTIREYGQLCVEFLKKNSTLVNPVVARVEQLKEAGDTYSCLDDDDFMIDDTLRYECDDKCIILPDYFIDLTKSKESKRKGNDSPPSTASSNANGNGHSMENDHSKNQHPTSGLSRSEQRKRRSSVMIQKIRNASVCSFSTNPSIQSAMNNHGNGNGNGNGNGASSPPLPLPLQQPVEYCESLTPSPSNQGLDQGLDQGQGQGMQLGTYISGEGSATYLRHPSTSTIGLRRKSKVSRNGSVSGMENHGMVSKAKHKRNVSDPLASAGDDLLADKINGDLSLFDGQGQGQGQLQGPGQGQGQGLSEAFNFPSPQVDFKFNMFDEPDLGLNLDVNLNSLNLSEMALNSISMNMGAGAAAAAAEVTHAHAQALAQSQSQSPSQSQTQAQAQELGPDQGPGPSHGTVTVSTSEVDSRLPSDDITEMSSFSMNPVDQFQYIHTDKHRQSQALRSNNSVLHLDKLSEPQSLSSTLPTTPQDMNTLLPVQGHESLLLEFSPEEPNSALSALDPLYPLYPSSMLTAVPSDAFASYEDFIAN